MHEVDNRPGNIRQHRVVVGREAELRESRARVTRQFAGRTRNIDGEGALPGGSASYGSTDMAASFRPTSTCPEHGPARRHGPPPVETR